MKENVFKNRDEYKVVINDFEGPLDLLLYLITQNKMNIFDISLSDLTDKYIEYLNAMQSMNLDITSEFVVMAATLINIKSRKLLPEIEDKSEKDDEEISEEEMLARIIRYKKYKEISDKINEMYHSNFGCFLKPIENIKFVKPKEYTGSKFDPNRLKEIYVELLFRNTSKINKNADAINRIALLEKYTVREKARQIIDYLKDNESLNFNSMFDETSNVETVTALLSTLELSKMKQVNINQEELFSDIYLAKNTMFDIEYDFSKME